MKKITSILLVMILCVSLLASCGKSAPGKTGTGTQAETGEPVVTDSPVTTDEPVATDPQETDPPAPEKPEMPSQDYIGTWYTNETGERPLYMYEGSIRILRITDEYIHFNTNLKNDGGEWIHIPYFAMPRNGEYVFSKEVCDLLGKSYGGGDDAVNGTLTFGDHSVTLTLGDQVPDESLKGMSVTFTIQDQADFLDWPAEGLPDTVTDEINATIDEMEEKGWENIRVLDHEPETTDFWGQSIEPYDNPEGDDLYCVIGRYYRTYVVMTLKYDAGTGECSRVRVYYMPGHLNTENEVESFLEQYYPENAGTPFIVPADDYRMAYSTEGDNSRELPEGVGPRQPEEDDEWVKANRVIPDEIPEFDKESVDIMSDYDIMNSGFYWWFNTVPKYRSTYYANIYEVWELVDREELTQWRSETMVFDRVYGIEPDEMYLVTFIKHFHITREQFDTALEELRKNDEERLNREGSNDKPKDERFEIPNGDIIYTFDNEIINNYYRRDQG
ncbi:MAG: hypothetical protein IKI91_06530 [Clostridia bacterium]|nr:hypothetical protein [Clostridia bacterium]